MEAPEAKAAQETAMDVDTKPAEETAAEPAGDQDILRCRYGRNFTTDEVLRSPMLLLSGRRSSIGCWAAQEHAAAGFPPTPLRALPLVSTN
jgi:hypothetical protein